MLKRLSPFVLAIACGLAAPGIASAAHFGLDADGGIGPGNVVRDPNPKIGITFATEYRNEQRVTVTVVGPDGVRTHPSATCGRRRSFGPYLVHYRGDGPYRVVARRYGKDNSNCSGTPVRQQTYTFHIKAMTPIAAPGRELLYRDRGRTTQRTWEFPVAYVPGALSHDVVFGRALQLAPNGGYANADGKAINLTSRGRALVRFPGPGTYVVAAHASGYHRDAVPGQQIFAPWSAITVNVKAPFDVRKLGFPDRRGPSYRVTAYIGERNARGNVRVYLARRGKKRYSRYKKLGVVKIRRGKVTKRFRVRRPGRYKLKYTYRGSSTIAKGHSVHRIRVYRRYFRR